MHLDSINKDNLLIVASFLQNGEIGILNFIDKKFKRYKFKININPFILNSRMLEWYIKTFNFDIKVVNPRWSIKHNFINCLKFCINKNKYSCNQWSCNWSAYYNNLSCLQLLYNYGYYANHFGGYKAASNNSIECLKYLHSKNCKLNIFTIEHAIKGDSLESLAFLIKIICLSLKDINNLINLSYKSHSEKSIKYLKTYKEKMIV